MYDVIEIVDFYGSLTRPPKKASKIWGHGESYVRNTWRNHPEKFPAGTIREFGRILVVMTAGMGLDRPDEEGQKRPNKPIFDAQELAE